MKEKFILAVDTSSPQAGFALASGERLLAAFVDETARPHSQSFFPNLAKLFELAGVKPEQLDGLAANTGPGSFTGLRVGLAAISGLAQTLSRPAFGVNTLDLTALSVGQAGRVLALLEAGRSEVYAGLRDVTETGEPLQIGSDFVGRLEAMFDWDGAITSVPLIWAGGGAQKHWQELAELALSKRVPTDDWQLSAESGPLAPILALYAAKLLQAGRKADLRAYYLRPADAELKAPKQ
jgi:tRNA threonylcarbamoyladenosine biosynthesis protein TsaB